MIRRLLFLFLFLLYAIPVPDCPADDAIPRLTQIVPPGITLGARQTWTLTGENLERVERVVIEGNDLATTIQERGDRTLTVEVIADSRAITGFRAVRVEGPEGISNPRIVRVDGLGQTMEREPNDRWDEATLIRPGTAAVAELKPQDIDHFRVKGRAGQEVAIEVEARRLGVAIAPLVTVMSTDGRALHQGREAQGVDGDCRFLYRYPSDADYVIQVRDLLYGGAAGSWYRLRVTDEPFATALFPLGGPAGYVANLTVSGGNLAALALAFAIPEGEGRALRWRRSFRLWPRSRLRCGSLPGRGRRVLSPNGSSRAIDG